MSTPNTLRALASGRLIALSALGLFAGGLAVALLPGLMTPDALDMCNQALHSAYTNWHSPIIAGIWGFVDATPETIIVSQTFALVAAIYLIVSRWLRRSAAVIATIVITLLPTTLGWVAHIGKDQWSAIAVLLAIAALARLDETAGRQRVWCFALALFLLWLAVAARANAIVPAVVILFLSGDRVWASIRNSTGRRTLLRRLGVVLMFAIAVVGSQRVWVSTIVQPAIQYPMQPNQQFDLVALSVRTNELLLPESSLTPGATLDDLRSHFQTNGSGVDKLLFPADAPVRFRISDPAVEREIKQAWLDAIISHPLAYVKHRLAVTRAMLGISTSYPHGGMYDPGSRPETWGLDCDLPTPYFPEVQSGLLSIPRVGDQWTIWRVWWMLLVIVGGAYVVGYRRSAEARMLVGYSISTIATFAMFAGAPLMRYFWPINLSWAIMVALALSRVTALARSSKADRHRASSVYPSHTEDRSVGPPHVPV